MEQPGPGVSSLARGARRLMTKWYATSKECDACWAVETKLHSSICEVCVLRQNSSSLGLHDHSTCWRVVISHLLSTWIDYFWSWTKKSKTKATYESISPTTHVLCVSFQILETRQEEWRHKTRTEKTDKKDCQWRHKTHEIRKAAWEDRDHARVSEVGCAPGSKFHKKAGISSIAKPKQVTNFICFPNILTSLMEIRCIAFVGKHFFRTKWT